MENGKRTGNGIDSGASPLIVIASNRGPFSFKEDEQGNLTSQRGEGGLVTALSGLSGNHDVVWVAAALGKGDITWAQEHSDHPQEFGGMKMQMIIPDRGRYRQYYNVISNPLLWFIQHELWEAPLKPGITVRTWEAWREGYVAINRQFAQVIVKIVQEAGSRPVIILPQDYHLYMMPHFLREALGNRVQIQPFIHIPWPGPDAWRILPAEMRNQLFSSLLQSDRIGFQTSKDAFNFVQTCRFHLHEAHAQGRRDRIEYNGRSVEARAYPITVDPAQVKVLADEQETRLTKRQMINVMSDNRLILRVDRIEPSKNILRGLQAFRALLEAYPEYRGKVKMLALLVPSRTEVDEYRNYLGLIMTEAGMINAEFSDELYEPVRIIVGNNYRRAIAAMQLYDVLLVNPIADGMNLVAKEGVLVNEKNGVLVLSEHAGAVYELGDYALTVSPFDIYGTVQALREALEMPVDERFRRATALRELVENDGGVGRWFQSQLDDALRAFNNQSRNASTSATPETIKSAEANTESGIASDSTPSPSA
jgi:trehalose 6-phosphate synthase